MKKILCLFGIHKNRFIIKRVLAIKEKENIQVQCVLTKYKCLNCGKIFCEEELANGKAKLMNVNFFNELFKFEV